MRKRRKHRYYPNVISAHKLRTDKYWAQRSVGGSWTAARPISYPTLRQRIVIAWRVFTGKYDALVWPDE